MLTTYTSLCITCCHSIYFTFSVGHLNSSALSGGECCLSTDIVTTGKQHLQMGIMFSYHCYIFHYLNAFNIISINYFWTAIAYRCIGCQPTGPHQDLLAFTTFSTYSFWENSLYGNYFKEKSGVLQWFFKHISESELVHILMLMYLHSWGYNVRSGDLLL